jgi:hypothetical protein
LKAEAIRQLHSVGDPDTTPRRIAIMDEIREQFMESVIALFSATPAKQGQPSKTKKRSAVEKVGTHSG